MCRNIRTLYNFEPAATEEEIHSAALQYVRKFGDPVLKTKARDVTVFDDALRGVIQTARQLTKNRVITLFGCGGDRDRTKRPLMGMAAAELSDYVVLTSDNPRGEEARHLRDDLRNRPRCRHFIERYRDVEPALELRDHVKDLQRIEPEIGDELALERRFDGTAARRFDRLNDALFDLHRCLCGPAPV